MTERLRFLGWPSSQQINVDVHLKARDPKGSLKSRDPKRPQLQQLLEEERIRAYAGAVVHELTPVSPTFAAACSQLASDPMFVRKVALQNDSEPIGDSEARLLTALRRRRDWRALLYYVASGNERLIDAFFDQLVRDRRPAATHRFVAFLAQLLNWQLILTTNFDDLIETALRDEGLQPVVYEITRQSTLPDAQLVRAHRSIIKLHGGAFGLRTGQDLDSEMNESELAAFRRYMPPDALLLVLGYGGGDRRVMSLIDILTAGARNGGQPRVVWLYRNALDTLVDQVSRAANRVTEPEKSVFWSVKYRDGGLFLQELYHRITLVHPVTTSSYQALPLLPLPPEADPRHPRSDGSAPSTIFESVSTLTASQGLAAHVRALEDNNYQAIWIDLSGVRSCETMLSIISEDLCRFDRWLHPIVSSVAFTAENEEARKRSVKVALRWLGNALRRGRYILAFDSVGEFGRAHPADPLLKSEPESSSAKTRVEEAKALIEFLRDLRKRASNGEFGESRLAFALPRGGQPETNGRPDELAIRLVDPPDGGGLSDETVSIVNLDDDASAGEALPGATSSEDSLPDPTIEEIQAWLKTEQLPKHVLALAYLASAFRRPRSIVGLAFVTEILGNECAGDALPADGKERPFSSLGTRSYDQSSQRVAGLQEPLKCALIEASAVSIAPEGRRGLPLFVVQDGGFVWMPLAVRDALYSEMKECFPACIPLVHRTIAQYYYEQLYAQSRDIRAYFEFLFHGLVSALEELDRARRAGQAAEPDAEQIAQHRANAHRTFFRLRGVLEREKRHLLGHARAMTLVRTLVRVSDEVRYVDDGSSTIAELLETVDEVRALALREAGEFGRAKDIRKEQHTRAAAPFAQQDFSFNSDTLERRLVKIPLSQTLRHKRYELEEAICESLEVRGRGTGIQKLGLAEEVARSHSTGMIEPRDRGTATKLQIRSCLHALNAILREIECKGVASNRSVKKLQRTGDRAYERCDELLKLYDGRQAARYICYHRCFGARLAYLHKGNRSDLGKSYRLLNEAQAAIARGTAPSDRLALAVSYLHLAELSLEDAEGPNPTSKSGSYATGSRRSSEGGGLDRERVLTALLAQVEVALEQARRILSEGLRSAQWWTWLYVLQARLSGNLLKLDLTSDKAFAGHMKGVDRDTVLLDALSAIGAGLTNYHLEDERLGQLKELWLRLHQSYSDLRVSDARDSWAANCERVGVLDMWREEVSPSSTTRVVVERSIPTPGKLRTSRPQPDSQAGQGDSHQHQE